MFKNIFLNILIVFTCMMSSIVHAGKVELTTYYPAPSGEYDNLQSKKTCVGTDCTGTAVGPGNLRVKKNATTSTGGDLTVDNDATVVGTITSADADISGTLTSNDLTVTGTTTMSNTGGFVIQRRSAPPSAPAEGQIWIE